jgi:exosome complex component RRP45
MPLVLQVWHLRVDVKVLGAQGGVAGAAGLAALAALSSFRRPDATVEAAGPAGALTVVVHPPEEREPLPLTLHHGPLPVVFALFEVSWGQGWIF